MDSRNRARNAFTLIELLVVVSIISLLIAVLLPALSAAREQARRTQCASNQRQFGIALAVYDQEHGELPQHQSRNEVQQANIMRDWFGVPGDLVMCPSITERRIRGGRAWDTAPGVAQLDYHYWGGAGTHPRYPKWNGDHVWNAPRHADGYFPPMSMSEPYWFIVNDAGDQSFPVEAWKQPLMQDWAYHMNAADHSFSTYMPPNGAHVGSDGNAEGTNVLFLDGRVEWHRYTPGEAWMVMHRERSGGRPYGWWNPHWGAPDGALILPTSAP